MFKFLLFRYVSCSKVGNVRFICLSVDVNLSEKPSIIDSATTRQFCGAESDLRWGGFETYAANSEVPVA